MPAVTKEEQQSIANEFKGIQEQPSGLSNEFDKKTDSQNAKPKDTTSRNSLDVSPTEDIKSNSLINRESLKQDSSVAIAAAVQSHQIDRPLTFIR
jgi:hypothetical protein